MNTKKVLKQMLIIILMALTLIVGANFALAIEPEDKGTIRISKVEPGLKVTVYRLATVNYYFDEAEEGPIDPPYSWVDEIKEFIEGSQDYKEYADPETFQRATKEDAGKVADFYDALAAQIRGKKLELESTAKVVELGSTSTLGEPTESVDIDELEMGTYLVLIENGYKVYRPSVVNLVPKFENDAWSMTTPAVVEIKSSDMTITKTIEDEKVSTTDTIKYTVEADVPQYPKSALAKNYSISDKLSDALTLDEESIELYGLQDEEWKQITKDDVCDQSQQRPNAAGESTFTLNFNYDNIKQYTKIKVTYTAKLKTDETTILSEEGNKNTAYLDYSNNPYEVDAFKSIESSKNVFTYKATINKKDKYSDEMLIGAEFTLSTDKAGEQKLKFIEHSDGIYYVSDADLANEKLVVGSAEGTKGKLEIRGLGDGTYYLQEVKAPNGYNRLKDSVVINVENDNVTIDVKNDKGFILPITGGSGTIIFTVLGSVLFGIGLLLIAIVIYRKVSSKK